MNVAPGLLKYIHKEFVPFITLIIELRVMFGRNQTGMQIGHGKGILDCGRTV